MRWLKEILNTIEACRLKISLKELIGILKYYVTQNGFNLSNKYNSYIKAIGVYVDPYGLKTKYCLNLIYRDYLYEIIRKYLIIKDPN